jgi:arabinose-5-phosphate isomerase
MKDMREIIAIGKHCLQIEEEAVSALKNSLDTTFAEVVMLMAHTSGRVVVTGIGKSALIGQKIAATLNSTGTAAMFLHAADAMHGDIGMVQANDIILCLSKSGETPEIKALVPPIKQMGAVLIGITAQADSILAKSAHHVLLTPIEREADPNNLAPTASTIAQLALGDALAMALITVKGFTSTDFARVHPGGSLGKQLHLKASELANRHTKPAVMPHDPIRDVIIEMTKGRLGAVAVVNPDNQVLGIITDGDIRRMLEKYTDLQGIDAQSIMHNTPKCIGTDAMATQALALMQEFAVAQLILVDTKNNQYHGMVHVQDLLSEGLI